MSVKNMPEEHEDRSLTCGGCRWFETPYRGKNCQERRNVKELTRACREFERVSYVPDISSIKKSALFKSVKAFLKSEVMQIDKESIEVEIQRSKSAASKNTNKAINYRFHNPLKDIVTLSKAFGKLTAYRDRLVEISINIDILLNELNKRRNKLLGTLAVEFPGIYEEFSSKVDRENLHTYLLGGLDTKIEDCMHISSIADKAIKNLDQMYWNLKEVKGLAEMIIARRSDQAMISGARVRNV